MNLKTMKHVEGRMFVDGFKATCPFCGKENVAVFDLEGKYGEHMKDHLIWWPNDEDGEWCDHCHGVYSAGHVTRVAFAFSR